MSKPEARRSGLRGAERVHGNASRRAPTIHFVEPAVFGSTRRCRICLEWVRFRLTESGSYLPVDADGGWHFLYCHGQLTLGLAS